MSGYDFIEEFKSTSWIDSGKIKIIILSVFNKPELLQKVFWKFPLSSDSSTKPLQQALHDLATKGVVKFSASSWKFFPEFTAFFLHNAANEFRFRLPKYFGCLHKSPFRIRAPQTTVPTTTSRKRHRHITQGSSVTYKVHSINNFPPRKISSGSKGLHFRMRAVTSFRRSVRLLSLPMIRFWHTTTAPTGTSSAQRPHRFLGPSYNANGRIHCFFS